MTTYRYKGRSHDGARVSGVVRAYDEYEAVAKLRGDCAFITKIEPIKEKKSILHRPIRFRIKGKELALLCSQFSILLSSGLPIIRCIEMVADQTRNKQLRQVLEKTAEEVGAGRSMAQSFEHNAPGLPATFIETIRAGEKSGSLEACFTRLHNYYDRTAKTKAKLVSSLTYPALVIAVAVVVFIIIIAVAVPAFTDAFAELGGEMPAITRGLIGFSNFLRTWWWLLLLIISLVIIAFLVARRTERGHVALSAYALRRAPLRRLHTMSAAGQFATALSTMVAAGLPLPEALSVAGSVSGSYVFSLAARQVRQGVERGRSISESMKGVEYFPPMLSEMIGVGESSGSLEQTLDVVGNYFNSEVESATNRLLAILEPAITVGLAVIVVIMLLAVYLPMFTMYGSI